MPPQSSIKIPWANQRGFLSKDCSITDKAEEFSAPRNCYNANAVLYTESVFKAFNSTRVKRSIKSRFWTPEARQAEYDVYFDQNGLKLKACRIKPLIEIGG